MRVVLGAWGMGAYLADYSEIWKDRFGTKGRTLISLPPMSARFSGMVEPLPFVLAKKIFIDFNQCDMLFQRGQCTNVKLNENLPLWLREFENSDVLAPIDFRAILKRNAAMLAQTAEELLASDAFILAAVDSSILWNKFLYSPGAEFLPDLQGERVGTSKVWDSRFRNVLNLRDHPDIAKMVHTDSISVAALQCGHDIFDVVAMLSISHELDAVLCDWQMYDPLYSMTIRNKHFNFMFERSTTFDIANLRWYVPLPKVLDIDQMLDIRNDTFLQSLRNTNLATTVSSLGQLNSTKAWRELRSDIQGRLKGAMLNPYIAHQQQHASPVLTESLDRPSVMLNPNESLPATIQLYSQEIIMGSKFSDISGSNIVNESLMLKSYNKISKLKDENMAKALLEIAKVIDHSGDKEAGALFESFNEHLQENAPNSTVLKTLWNGIVERLPTISNMVDTVTKISALFS